MTIREVAEDFIKRVSSFVCFLFDDENTGTITKTITYEIDKHFDTKYDLMVEYDPKTDIWWYGIAAYDNASEDRSDGLWVPVKIEGKRAYDSVEILEHLIEDYCDFRTFNRRLL